jgi:hypothetical protein
MRRISNVFLATLALGCAARPTAPPVSITPNATARPLARVVIEFPSLVTPAEADALHAAIVASLRPREPREVPVAALAPIEPLVRADLPESEEGTVPNGRRLPPESIRRVVHQSAGQFRACYQRALLGNPEAAGRILVRFSIGPDGRVSRAEEQSASLEDRGARRCILEVFFELTFPTPAGHSVVVDYPLSFTHDGRTPPDPLPSARRVAEPPPPGFADAMRSGRRAVPAPPVVAPAPLRLRGSRSTRCSAGDPLCSDL